MTLPATPGIYAITHIASGKQYIGSTESFGRRWSDHLYQLEARRHHSRYLQRAWLKSGKDAFRFDILEHVPVVADLFGREQWWLDDRFARRNAHEYNMSPTAS